MSLFYRKLHGLCIYKANRYRNIQLFCVEKETLCCQDPPLKILVFICNFISNENCIYFIIFRRPLEELVNRYVIT